MEPALLHIYEEGIILKGILSPIGLSHKASPTLSGASPILEDQEFYNQTLPRRRACSHFYVQHYYDYCYEDLHSIYYKMIQQ